MVNVRATWWKTVVGGGRDWWCKNWAIMNRQCWNRLLFYLKEKEAWRTSVCWTCWVLCWTRWAKVFDFPYQSSHWNTVRWRKCHVKLSHEDQVRTLGQWREIGKGKASSLLSIECFHDVTAAVFVFSNNKMATNQTLVMATLFFPKILRDHWPRWWKRSMIHLCRQINS